MRVILSVRSIIHNTDHLKMSWAEATYFIFTKTEKEISQIS